MGKAEASKPTMKRSASVAWLGFGGLLLLAAVVAILLQMRAPRSGAISQPAAPPVAPPVAEPAPPPPAASPPIRPAEPAARAVLGPPQATPAGTIVARPPAAGDRPIVRPPLGERIVRDHRGEPVQEVPRRSFSPAGLSAAVAALTAAVATCAPSARSVSLGFTLVSAGGRAQARDPYVRGANGDPDAQQCIEQALAALSWPTPDGDSEDPITLPLRLR